MDSAVAPTSCRRISFVLASALVLTAAIAGASPVSEPAAESAALDGRALYQQACASCHGVDRRGDGPEASNFVPPPPALTASTLAAASEGQLVARLRDGTPLVLAPDPRALKRRLGKLEDVTAHLQRLPDVDWARVDEGSAIYAARCAQCHGPFGQPLAPTALPTGVQRPPRDLRDPTFQRAQSDAELIVAMQHGKSAMPAIPGVRDEQQAQSVLVFIRLLSPGFETYSYYCAACHGDGGRGDGVFATGKNDPQVVFDRAWLAAKDPEQLRIDVAHMMAAHGATMPHLRSRLSDDQLRAVVRYLKEG
jgi:mono/diheme cytochrome c family protein